MANAARLRELMQYIITHPERWQQDEWASQTECGTAYCVAGTAVTLFTDARPIWYENTLGPGLLAAFAYIGTGCFPTSIELLAREVLDLTPGQSDLLFHPHNDLDDLWAIVGDLTDGQVERFESATRVVVA